ncbi:MAG TPA: glycosyltransferase family 4 protein [Flavobacterium sp.]|nr:glycosyltransferase family 4 protein [Flavobacterium sp.]
MQQKKLIRVTTVPLSIDKLLTGQLRFLGSFFDVMAVSSDLEYLKRCAEREGVRFAAIDMTRGITPLKDFVALVRFVFLFYKERPFIVHSQTPKAGLLAMLAAKVMGVPVRLHTVGGLPLMEATGMKRKLLIAIEQLTYRCAHRVYVNSHGLSAYMVSEGLIRPEKLEVLGNGSTNGVDTRFFSRENILPSHTAQLREQLGIDPDDFVVVFVGRIVKDKGIVELVDAFLKVAAKYEHAKLLLVGMEEPETDPLPSLTLGKIADNRAIISVGFKDDVRPYLAMGNVLVLPSYREGFPNVVLQAGSMELPVIATNINGCNEIIVDGVSGLLVPVKNTLAIQHAILRLLNEPELSQQMGRSARERIEAFYGQAYLWKQIAHQYALFEQKVTNPGVEPQGADAIGAHAK